MQYLGGVLAVGCDGDLNGVLSMTYMNHQAAFAGGIEELTFNEIELVNGGDRGDATANGAVVGGGAAAAYMTAARFASYGARIGVAGGIAGVIGGAIIGGAIGYAAYEIGKGRDNKSEMAK